MEKINDIDFAIVETLKAHPEFTDSMNLILADNLTSGITLRNFTSNNGARDKMRSVTTDDLLYYVLEEAIKCYNSMVHFYFGDFTIRQLRTPEQKIDKLVSIFPYYGVLNKAMSLMANPRVNTVIYYKSNSKELLSLVDAIVDTRFKKGPGIIEYINANGKGATYVDPYGEVNLHNKLISDIEKSKVAQNINVNQGAFNQCLTDVLNGSQIKNRRNEYGLDGTLYATQDIGRNRENQEDSLLILEHPNNKEFKLLAVADGMGGVEYGDKASSYIVQRLASWFNSLQVEFFDYPDDLQDELNRQIASISNEIYNKFNRDGHLRCGSTLVASVITRNKTITSSIGDSRIYAVKNNRLTLLTKDESAVWPPYVDPKNINPEELDYMRFLKDGNMIANCMGRLMNIEQIQTKMVPNESYDKLLLFTDGVTDLLTQEQIRYISTNYPTDQITRELVNAALSKNAVNPFGGDDYSYDEIQAGKDNASAAMYSRR